VPAITWASAVVTILYLVQAGIGIAVVAVGENTVVEVLHSSIGSLTWVALMALLSLTRTLPRTLRP
jgi:heme A synthase